MCRDFGLTYKWSIFLLIVFAIASLALIPFNSLEAAAPTEKQKERKGGKSYFHQVARKFPSFKTIVQVEFKESVVDHLLSSLKSSGLRPVNQNWNHLLGRSKGIFVVRARRLNQLEKSEQIETVDPLSEFLLYGSYHIDFRINEETSEFRGPLKLLVTGPRNGFGKRLVKTEVQIRPSLPYRIRRDSAGNRWIEAKFPNPEHGQKIQFDFRFSYQVDVRRLLEHALAMISPEEGSMAEYMKLRRRNSAALKYLRPAEKIDSNSPGIRWLAKDRIGSTFSPVKAYWRIHRFMEETIDYDQEKKEAFFGGRKVYRNMGRMYQPAEKTLEMKSGACPDISVLETALLRAAAFPARTAGRWGHFYTQIYLPGRGWLSPSVTPTGIPLVRDVNHSHKPFVTWSPHISLQITNWWGQIQVMTELTPTGGFN